jgi:hypothetical protein
MYPAKLLPLDAKDADARNDAAEYTQTDDFLHS